MELHISICQAPSYSVFHKALLDFIWSTANSTFGNNVSGLKKFIRLGVGFTHPREHKLKHNFQDTLNPLYLCPLKAGGTYQRNVLFDYLNSINSKILKLSENEIVQVLLFFLERNLFDIFSPLEQKLEIFSPSVSVFYVIYLLWREVMFSFCVCV